MWGRCHMREVEGLYVETVLSEGSGGSVGGDGVI